MGLRRRTPPVALFLGLAFASPAFPASPPSLLPPPSLPSAFEDPDDVPLPDKDLWERIRMGFALEALESPLVAENEAWYASRPEYIKRFVDRGSLYLHHIVEQVEKRGMPSEIALLPVVESAFVPKANSRAKASGLWQFIPSTGKNYGLTQDWWRDNRRDVVAATDAALNYLQRLHDMFGTWELALAAYNCGEGCVSRAIAWNQRKGLPTDYLSLGRLPNETRNYVPRLVAVKNIVLSPPSYGIELESVPDTPYFTAVKSPPKIDVKVAAKLAGMTEEDFIALNPSHNKPVAVAQAAGTLIVPRDKADAFESNLAAYDQPLVSWTTYQARKGESLDAIARKHGLTAGQLRLANDSLKLDKRGRLRAGGPVLVPMTKTGAKAAKLAQVAPVRVAAAGPMPVRVHAAAARHHVVRGGDSLYAIARRYGTTVEELAELNGLSAASMLRPGQKLNLP
jgi:membrane-bound lytic murein transglycosylase D